MARRRPGAFDSLATDDTRLQDYSDDLWDAEISDVSRRLLNSAVRCYASKGFQATTTRDISGGAGLSPAAMYVYYSSKEHLLYEISRMGHLRSLEELQLPASERGEAADELRALVFHHVAWHARYHVAARVNQYEIANLTPEHYEEIRQLRRDATALFRAAVVRGIEDGSFGPIDPTRVVRAIMALSIDPVRWYRLDGPDSPEELGEFYANLALAMVTYGGQALGVGPADGQRVS